MNKIIIKAFPFDEWIKRQFLDGGSDSDYEEVECSNCDGDGEAVATDSNYNEYEVTCAECDGSGVVELSWDDINLAKLRDDYQCEMLKARLTYPEDKYIIDGGL